MPTLSQLRRLEDVRVKLESSPAFVSPRATEDLPNPQQRPRYPGPPGYYQNYKGQLIPTDVVALNNRTK
jgi:hypothetical protein